ncbi:MAG: WhiB family transcriptional regulator [Ilumatobacteraceae bacterium]
MSDQPFHDLISNTADQPWLDRALCGDLPLDELELYFVEAGRSISRQTIERCTVCPVRRECLDHAYALQIASGYFGGMSPSRRKALSHAEALREIGVADADAG